LSEQQLADGNFLFLCFFACNLLSELWEIGCSCIIQELSYRKQIAHQLLTQHVEGIYRPNCPVTLKERLSVTQVNWKRDH